jgi:uncharacterized protein (TIGR02271 family)
MISEQNIDGLIGCDVVDDDGDKIGTVGQVYVDPATGRPNWATVRTGFFGMSESFVPLEDADHTDGRLRVPYDKAKVKDAPNIDPDRELSETEEDRLYEYYGHGGSGTTGYDASGTGATDVDRGSTATTGYDAGTTGHDTDRGRDDAMTRSEERLNVGTERVQTGRARLRKYVVTEQQNVTVPVSREEVRLEREPITDANRGDAYRGPDITEDEHEVTLTEERPVIEKETVPVERVRLDTETVTDTERVSGDVRKEEIELEDDSSGRRNR